jgi:glycosyltransferase involved in cell wall biosynthesis
MNLIILTPGFAADESDTTCIPGLQDLVQSYGRLYPQMHIHIIALHYPFREGEYCWNGVTVYAAGGRNSKARKLSTWWRVLRRIRALHSQQPMSVLHSFWLSESTLLGQIASRLYGIPHLATIMGQDAKPDNKYLPLIGALQRLFENSLFARRNPPKSPFVKGDFHLAPLTKGENVLAKQERRGIGDSFQSVSQSASLSVFALSEFAAKMYAQSTGRVVQGIIPFGIVPHGIVPALSHEEVNDLAKTRNIDILGVGSVIPLKNYTTFLELVANAKQHRSGIRAVILGGFVDAAEVEHLRSVITELQIEENVVLVGEVPRSEVFSMMAQSTVLLHTSEYEGQGWVLLEALHYGASVVCFDVGYTMAHPRMYVCQSTADMELALREVLDANAVNERTQHDSTPVSVPSIDDTARAYFQHYHLHTNCTDRNR